MNTPHILQDFEPDTVLIIEIHTRGTVKIGYRFQGREWFPEGGRADSFGWEIEKCYKEYCRREKAALDKIGREQAKTLDVPELSRIISGRWRDSPFAQKEYPRITETIALNEMHRRLREDQPRRVEGPAMIAFLKGKAIMHRQLHPGEIYEGVCLRYDVGIYD